MGGGGGIRGGGEKEDRGWGLPCRPGARERPSRPRCPLEPGGPPPPLPLLLEGEISKKM